MKTQTLTLISIAVSIALSLTATLATYNITKPQETRFIHAMGINRGWPLHWITESWSLWTPTYPHYFTLQPANFLIDLIFYVMIFQIPTQIYIYSRKARKTKSEQQRLDTNTHTANKPSSIEVVVHRTRGTDYYGSNKFGVITCSKRKLITHENSTPHKQTAPACSSSTVPTCPATPSIQRVDVTGNNLTTTSTQPSPETW